MLCSNRPVENGILVVECNDTQRSNLMMACLGFSSRHKMQVSMLGAGSSAFKTLHDYMFAMIERTKCNKAVDICYICSHVVKLFNNIPDKF